MLPIPVIETPSPKAPDAIRPQDVLPLLEPAGAVLLRGFDFNLPRFESFSQMFCDRFHIPATRYARRQPKGDSYSTEVFRNNYTLLGHTEGTYKPYPHAPEMCFFMCVTPPCEQGGETTLVDGEAFYNALPEVLRQRFARSGVTYEMTWDKERWQNEFEMEDTQSLLALLSRLPDVRYTLDGEVLHLFYTTRAITLDSRGHKVFANALLAHLPRITHPGYQDKQAYVKASNRVYFGDGEAIDDRIINELIDIHDALAYAHAWKANDMLVIDNTRTLHGRTLTVRDCERVLVSRFGWPKQAAQ